MNLNKRSISEEYVIIKAIFTCINQNYKTQLRSKCKRMGKYSAAIPKNLLFTSHRTAGIMSPEFRRHVAAAVMPPAISNYPVNNSVRLTVSHLTSLFLILFPILLLWCPLRRHFYSAWITCPSWRWACWSGIIYFL